MSEALVVLNTCPDEATARELARALVEQRVAACVNILPSIRSIYPWQGKVQDEEEVLLVIKTLQSRFAALESWLREQHPYDVPEIVALQVAEVSDAYLDWMKQGLD